VRAAGRSHIGDSLPGRVYDFHVFEYDGSCDNARTVDDD
jgi:hypothetical protein